MMRYSEVPNVYLKKVQHGTSSSQWRHKFLTNTFNTPNLSVYQSSSVTVAAPNFYEWGGQGGPRHM